MLGVFIPTIFSRQSQTALGALHATALLLYVGTANTNKIAVRYCVAWSKCGFFSSQEILLEIGYTANLILTTSLAGIHLITILSWKKLDNVEML